MEDEIEERMRNSAVETDERRLMKSSLRRPNAASGVALRHTRRVTESTRQSIAELGHLGDRRDSEDAAH